ncbi:hypothetical protein ACH5RR_038357 [Cinchona calisaya]|uniref:Uncharacterized protein n=1 Tax=Cinchona calisaya TaxID=153742 RepID=A0ABD2Y0S9_9GENT
MVNSRGSSNHRQSSASSFRSRISLWQDAENRVYLIEELDRRTGQGELEKARQEGFVSNHLSKNSGTHEKKKLLAVTAIFTRFGSKNNRDAICKGGQTQELHGQNAIGEHDA